MSLDRLLVQAIAIGVLQQRFVGGTAPKKVRDTRCQLMRCQANDSVFLHWIVVWDTEHDAAEFEAALGAERSNGLRRLGRRTALWLGEPPQKAIKRSAAWLEVVEVGSHRRGIVEELEKAHIYIARLHGDIGVLRRELASLNERLAQMEAGR